MLFVDDWIVFFFAFFVLTLYGGRRIPPRGRDVFLGVFFGRCVKTKGGGFF